jgi:hypothetical protein
VQTFAGLIRPIRGNAGTWENVGCFGAPQWEQHLGEYLTRLVHLQDWGCQRQYSGESRISRRVTGRFNRLGFTILQRGEIGIVWPLSLNNTFSSKWPEDVLWNNCPVKREITRRFLSDEKRVPIDHLRHKPSSTCGEPEIILIIDRSIFCNLIGSWMIKGSHLWHSHRSANLDDLSPCNSWSAVNDEVTSPDWTPVACQSWRCLISDVSGILHLLWSYFMKCTHGNLVLHLSSIPFSFWPFRDWNEKISCFFLGLNRSPGLNVCLFKFGSGPSGHDKLFNVLRGSFRGMEAISHSTWAIIFGEKFISEVWKSHFRVVLSPMREE